MAKTPWTARNGGTDKRPWIVSRAGEVAENAHGKPRTFATAKAAESAAEKLNDIDGIFVSGFKGVSEADAKMARERFLAGDTVPEVRGHFRDGDNKLMFSFSQVRRMRDEVFAPLVNDPEAIKALAAGPILNACVIVKYRHSREEVAASAERQSEMFAA